MFLTKTTSKFLRLGGLAVFGAVILANAAAAQVDGKIIGIIGQSLKFLSEPLSGDVRTAIVYSGANPASKAWADEAVAAISASPNAGDAVLQPVAVAADAFNGGDADLVLFADQTEDVHASVFGTAASAQTLTMSLGKACVEVAACVVSIDTSSGVKIFLNNEALENTGLEFQRPFLLLVKRL